MATRSILSPTAPNLPLGPQEYERRYVDQLNNILRLYFNQVDGALNFLATSVTLSTAVYTVATLPVTATVGARTFVSDSSVTTFNTTVVGGGSNTVPVFFNGTDWKVG